MQKASKSGREKVGLTTVEVFLQMCCLSTSIFERPRLFLCLQHAPITKPIYTQNSEEPDYRGRIAHACFDHSVATTGMSLLLYDVTTLYFEAEQEDDYRKVGYSKERRVDPQIVVGLLVDRAGFPLEIHSFEGNTAETHTILPVLTAFQDRHQVADMVVVADAGMLSDTNLAAIDAAGLRFIVGSRQTKAPRDLAAHFHHQPDAPPEDGTTVDTVTTRGRHQPNPDRINDPEDRQSVV